MQDGQDRPGAQPEEHSAAQPPGQGQSIVTPPGGSGSWVPPGQMAGPGQQPQRRRLHVFTYLVIAVLAAGVGAGSYTAVDQNPSAGGSAQQIPTPNPNSAANAGTLHEQAVENEVEPGLVDINSTLAYQNVPTAATGMILSSNGLVLTNNHVVMDSTDLTATQITTGRTYRARVLGVDPSQDVALIQLENAPRLTTVKFGDSSKVTLGTAIEAIGNAGGTGGQPTATTGTITALDRTITASNGGSGANSETLHDMLQTNAPIAEGDSGGAWANAAGQVIGMTTAADSQSLGGPGTSLGFGIPINTALSIARQIAAGQGSSRIILGAGSGVLGIGVDDLSDASSCLSNGGLGYTPPVNSGVLVCDVYPGTPAAKAGLAAGDVITEVNGRPVTSASALGSVLSNDRAGTTVALIWVDTNGQKHTSAVTLGQGPPK